jgi:hypothetical protein
MIDLDALKARLAEYDDARPRCQGKVARNINCAPDHLPSDDPTYHEYIITTYSPCCRPEGHESDCRNSRSVMGWPGFVTVSALVAEVERLREINDGFLLELGRQLALLRDQKRGEKEERAAVVALLRETIATSETASASDDLDYAIDIIERGEHRREEEK